jgi:hypothetical protein
MSTPAFRDRMLIRANRWMNSQDRGKTVSAVKRPQLKLIHDSYAKLCYPLQHLEQITPSPLASLRFGGNGILRYVGNSSEVQYEQRPV